MTIDIFCYSFGTATCAEHGGYAGYFTECSSHVASIAVYTFKSDTLLIPQSTLPNFVH